MIFPHSLKARLLLGGLLWTVGLFAGALLLFTYIMLRYQWMPRVTHGAAYSHSALVTVLTVICMIAGYAQFRRGLTPLRGLRSRLGAVREGQARQVEGTYPSEVQPLVDDLNALIAQREQAVARARAKAADLAHGLKTPLAVLAQDARRAAKGGSPDLAASIEQQVERMRRQVEYHLAQARAAAAGGGGGACAVKDSADGLVRALERLHAERGIAIAHDVDAGLVVRCGREDLDELLGNLLDNACRYARARVALGAAVDGPSIVMTVDDDGPGLPEAMRTAVLQRGVRADERGPGTGLGLAIVRDLAELYGGSIALASSPLGGLRARLILPSGTRWNPLEPVSP